MSEKFFYIESTDDHATVYRSDDEALEVIAFGRNGRRESRWVKIIHHNSDAKPGETNLSFDRLVALEQILKHVRRSK